MPNFQLLVWKFLMEFGLEKKPLSGCKPRYNKKVTFFCGYIVVVKKEIEEFFIFIGYHMWYV